MFEFHRSSSNCSCHSSPHLSPSSFRLTHHPANQSLFYQCFCPLYPSLLSPFFWSFGVNQNCSPPSFLCKFGNSYFRRGKDASFSAPPHVRTIFPKYWSRLFFLVCSRQHRPPLFQLFNIAMPRETFQCPEFCA